MSATAGGRQNRVDDLVSRLQSTGRIGDLETELARLDPRTLDEAERETWHHLWGIAAFRAGNHREALARFEEGFRRCPSSGMIGFSLGQEYEYFGRIPDMVAIFDRFRFPTVPSNYALAEARYAYLWGSPEKALDYVLPILEAYRQLKIADDTFLYIRGLPFYSQTWAYLGCFFEATRQLPRLDQITREAASQLSDFDFERLLSFLDGVRRDNCLGYASEQLKSMAKTDPEVIPTGYGKMQAAVIQALSADDVGSAHALLDSVTLSEKDFPWLEDIRLLAKCAIAHKARNREAETDLQTEFIRRQPLLFEPDHVFSFRLVQYQQELLPRYRATRHRGS